MKNTDYLQRSLHSVWHPCSQMKQFETLPLIPIARGEGMWLYDFEGGRYLDAISSWWVNLFGHCNPRINAALKDQLDRLEHVILAGFTHEPVIQLSERLSTLTGLGHCFYGSDGASATEIALKMSFHYWRNSGQPEKTRFISLQNSYHGETIGALSVTDVALFKDTYAPLLRQSTQVPTPDWRHAETGESPRDYAIRCAGHLRTHLEQHHAETAAFIIEPLVQGAAGMGMYDAEYLRQARAICDEFQVHLIADEIAVGFGRTGTMFAFEQANVPSSADTHAETASPSRTRRSAPTESGDSVSCRTGTMFAFEQANVPSSADTHTETASPSRTRRSAPAESGDSVSCRTGTMFAFEQANVPSSADTHAETASPSRTRRSAPAESGDSASCRTGTMFACEQAGIRPDFMCLSKGISGGYLPLSAVLTTDTVFQAFYHDETAKGFLHSHSYTGNALACRAALATLDIFEQDGVIEANRARAAYLTQAAQPLRDHPRVKNFRHTGMIWAFEVESGTPHFSRAFYQQALQHELLLRPMGNTVYFMPPYIISEAEIDLLIARTLKIVDCV
ncbi:MAG: aminotransferase class III-fold pyridoxal phosphate-dependent enzyme [Sulfuricella sp.]